MITASDQNLSYLQYNDETFGDLSLCNFEGTRFENCVFVGTTYGCNFTKAVFSACIFAMAVFNGCNFTDAAGLNPADMVGSGNNFGEIA